jgi:hypothetical protein
VLKDKQVQRFPGSPLLSTPDQVQQILASAGSGNVLTSDSDLRALAASLSDSKPVSTIQQIPLTAPPNPTPTANAPPPTAQPPEVVTPKSAPLPQAN